MLCYSQFGHVISFFAEDLQLAYILKLRSQEAFYCTRQENSSAHLFDLASHCN